MLNIDTIDKEILDLEKHDCTYATCEKLAWLYVVRDHLTPSVGSKSTPELSGSEFLECCSGCDSNMLLNVINEYMEAVKVFRPKEYSAVIKKIKEI